MLLLNMSVYNNFCAAPGRVCLQKLLRCSWMCLSTKICILLLKLSVYNDFVLLLDVPVNNSFYAAPERVCLTKAFMLLLYVSVYNNVYPAPERVCLQ
jgi:hypothetical protein